jgi:hypothetical protein
MSSFSILLHIIEYLFSVICVFSVIISEAAPVSAMGVEGSTLASTERLRNKNNKYKYIKKKNNDRNSNEKDDVVVITMIITS